MRGGFLALVSALALAACNPSSPAGSDSAAGGGGLFPDLTNAAYRAEATITHENGDTIPVVMIRSGRNLRMEITAPEGASTIITNADSGESYVITNQRGRTMAIRAAGLTQGFTDPADAWQGGLGQDATRTGTCSVAGQSGAEWTKTTTEDGADSVCVTDDGIILRATDDERVVWETTSVQRGPQSADLFVLPPGTQVMDLGNMGEMMNQALEAAKNR
jgi:hypothetical protein